MKKFASAFLCFILPILLFACMPAQQRGMAGSQYVSTSRPAFALGVANSLPLLSGGRGTTKLTDCGVMGGLLIDSWLATYGNMQQGPLAVIAHAEIPAGWYWDGVSPHPFSVDAGVEIINDMEFEAWTYAVNNRRNPFWQTTGSEDDNNGRWLVRCFAQRTDFDRGKIVLEYRERMPENITSLTALPLGSGDYLNKFAQRAHNVFIAATVPSGRDTTIGQQAVSNIRWQYLNERFWGTVSRTSYQNLR